MRTNHKVLVGKVLSHKMKKTVVVQVERRVRHRRLNKYVRQTKIYKVHDAADTCRVGDRISLIESRPLSKTKSWRVQKVLERSVVEGVGA